MNIRQKLQLSYWDGLVRDFFTPKATVKITLWKDNQRNEAKPFGSYAICAQHFAILTACRILRDRRPNFTEIFFCDNTIWGKVDDVIS